MSDGQKTRFAEAPNTGVFVCSHVWDEGHPITWVVHDGDGLFPWEAGAHESVP